jgi:hypothetical protein
LRNFLAKELPLHWTNIFGANGIVIYAPPPTLPK